MHAVLHLQTDGPDAQNHQTLKQGLGQARFGRLLTHDHRAQLAVISNKDELRTGGDEIQFNCENYLNYAKKVLCGTLVSITDGQ